MGTFDEVRNRQTLAKVLFGKGFFIAGFAGLAAGIYSLVYFNGWTLWHYQILFKYIMVFDVGSWYFGTDLENWGVYKESAKATIALIKSNEELSQWLPYAKSLFRERLLYSALAALGAYYFIVFVVLNPGLVKNMVVGPIYKVKKSINEKGEQQ